jgi:hypothetical protein
MKETVTVAVGSSGGDASSEKVLESISSKLGTFEMHIKGFGSKMMAKMGFIEGTGLGKDGRSGVLDLSIHLYHVNRENNRGRFDLVLNDWKIMVCTLLFLISALLVLMVGECNCFSPS